MARRHNLIQRPQLKTLSILIPYNRHIFLKTPVVFKINHLKPQLTAAVILAQIEAESNFDVLFGDMLGDILNFFTLVFKIKSRSNYGRCDGNGVHVDIGGKPEFIIG